VARRCYRSLRPVRLRSSSHRSRLTVLPHPKKLKPHSRKPTHPELPPDWRGDRRRPGDATTGLSTFQIRTRDLFAAGSQNLGERGARIVSVSPGLIATPMGAVEFGAQSPQAQMLARTPLQREGTMLEIADAVEFLASDRASFISGIDLLVDGGRLRFFSISRRSSRTAPVDACRSTTVWCSSVG